MEITSKIHRSDVISCQSRQYNVSPPPTHTHTQGADLRTSVGGWSRSGPGDGPTSVEQSSGRSIFGRSPTSVSATVTGAVGGMGIPTCDTYPTYAK